MDAELRAREDTAEFERRVEARARELAETIAEQRTTAIREELYLGDLPGAEDDGPPPPEPPRFPDER